MRQLRHIHRSTLDVLQMQTHLILLEFVLPMLLALLHHLACIDLVLDPFEPGQLVWRKELAHTIRGAVDSIESEHSGFGTVRRQRCSGHSVYVGGSELAQVGRPGQQTDDADVVFERHLFQVQDRKVRKRAEGAVHKVEGLFRKDRGAVIGSVLCKSEVGDGERSEVRESAKSFDQLHDAVDNRKAEFLDRLARQAD